MSLYDDIHMRTNELRDVSGYHTIVKHHLSICIWYI